MKVIGLITVAITGIMLLFAVEDFPDWADPNSPASLHLSPHYITSTIEETSVPNIVTSVLADYRAFDTMLETAVIFAAGVAVTAILRRSRKKGSKKPKAETGRNRAYRDRIVWMVSRQIVPFMQLFALYVIAHGHYSPGGGFQGGVILGASFILIGISADLKTMLERMSEKWNLLLGNIGVLIYAGIGVCCLLLGANFLDYSALSAILPATTPVEARSHSMLGIEIGVAIAVMAIMVAIYVNIASHGKYDKGL